MQFPNMETLISVYDTRGGLPQGLLVDLEKYYYWYLYTVFKQST